MKDVKEFVVDPEIHSAEKVSPLVKDPKDEGYWQVLFKELENEVSEVWSCL